MIAKLLEDIYGFQGLRIYTAQQSPDIWRLDEQPIQRKLEVGESTEHDVFVLHWHFGWMCQRTENLGVEDQETYGTSRASRSFFG